MNNSEKSSQTLPNAANIPTAAQHETPLYVAAANGKLEVVRVLLAAGANVNEANAAGKTPLYAAAVEGYLEIVQVLLAAKAEVDKSSNTGRTPLYVAASEGHLEVMQALVAAKADLNKPTNEGFTPLNIAIYNGHSMGKKKLLGIVHALLDAGADVEVANNLQVTPLHSAIRYLHASYEEERLEIMEALIKKGADVNRLDSYRDETPLLAAIRRGGAQVLAVVNLLVANKADVNLKNKEGTTPLYAAAAKGYKEVVEVLLQHGAQVDKTLAAGDRLIEQLVATPDAPGARLTSIPSCNALDKLPITNQPTAGSARGREDLPWVP